MSELEKEYKEVAKNLKDVSDQLKAHAEKSEKEIQAHRKMSEETKAEVDKLLAQQTALTKNLQDVEQKLVDLNTNPANRRQSETVGDRVAASEAYQAFGGSSAKGKFSVPLGAITSDLESAGTLIVPDRYAQIIAPQEIRLTVRDLLAWGRTESNSIEFVRETGFTNNADVVGENPETGKPESDIEFELDSEKIATIAHWVHASKQVLDDAKMLAAYINNRSLYGLKLKEEGQLLKGSGVGLNISGLVTQASAYANPGVVVQSETYVDRLRIAMLQVQLAEYFADGLVLNPIDWVTIELSKDKNNRYLHANPFGITAPTLWGRPVVESASMDLGEYLTGSFKLGALGWDRQDATITVSTEDRDNFIKNMVTILCENRVGLTVFRPEAFVKGDFEGVEPPESGGGEGSGEG